MTSFPLLKTNLRQQRRGRGFLPGPCSYSVGRYRTPDCLFRRRDLPVFEQQDGIDVVIHERIVGSH